MTAILIQSKVYARSKAVELDVILGHERILLRAIAVSAACG